MDTSNIDKHSPTWLAVAEHVNKRIDDLTRSLVAKNNDEVRGAIKELIKLIDLTKKRVRPVAAAEDDYHG